VSINALPNHLRACALCPLQLAAIADCFDGRPKANCGLLHCTCYLLEKDRSRMPDDALHADHVVDENSRAKFMLLRK
jgi:hypothetical protein